MQRLLLAIIAAILTFTGLGLFLSNQADYAGAASICLRSGLVLGALALALPQVKKLLEYAPPWFLACMAGGFLVIIRWPKAFPVVVPVLAALWFLGPRNRTPPVARPRARKRKMAKSHK